MFSPSTTHCAAAGLLPPVELDFVGGQVKSQLQFAVLDQVCRHREFLEPAGVLFGFPCWYQDLLNSIIKESLAALGRHHSLVFANMPLLNGP